MDIMDSSHCLRNVNSIFDLRMGKVTDCSVQELKAGRFDSNNAWFNTKLY